MVEGAATGNDGRRDKDTAAGSVRVAAASGVPERCVRGACPARAHDISLRRSCATCGGGARGGGRSAPAAASSPRSPPPRLLSFARRGDERAGPQRALRALAARSRTRSFSLGSQRPLLSRQGVGGGASASSCLPLDLRWCGVWSCLGERRRPRLAMAHAHHNARARARTAVMKRTSGHGPQPCNCSCKEAKKGSRGGRRGNRIRPAKRCCVAWALWRAGSAAGGGEVHFLAVVLSTRRQVAGSPPREGRKDATKPANAAPCSTRPRQSGNSRFYLSHRRKEIYPPPATP